MKKSIFIFVATLFASISSSDIIYAQFVKAEQITLFGNRLNSPIEMDVQINDNKIIFCAINKSYFPYEFEIKFTEFQNLSPKILENQTILHPGTNRLFTLVVVDPGQPPLYSYSYKYILGSSNYKADLSFPYLIPVGPGKIVKIHCSDESGTLLYHENHFKMKQNDTVFSARKGCITALPFNNKETDRIIKKSSLEILHNDGTVAVYEGLDPESIILKLGQTVYPGQYLGRIDYSEVLILNIYEFLGNGNLKNIQFYFSGSDGKLLSSRMIMDKKVGYPVEIIKKEFTKKEEKKFENGTLY